MSDRDDKNTAWQVSPSQYLTTRPEEFILPAEPVARYIAMRDGCRLAADIYISQGQQAALTFPTLLMVAHF